MSPMPPGAQAVNEVDRAIRAAGALGGKPRLEFDVKDGRVRSVRASIELPVEQAEVVAGRLEKLRAQERS